MITLLATEIGSESEIAFNLKDLGLLIAGIVSAVIAWLKIIHNNKTVNDKIAVLESQQKIDTMNAKNGRKALKEGLTAEFKERGEKIIETFKEKDEIVHKRINKTQEDMKSYMEKSDAEFKEIAKSISDVKTDTSEMKGMLKAVLDKK